MNNNLCNQAIAPCDSAALSLGDILKLGLLAAIWGASFIGMRLVVPEFGALLSATLRIVLAGIALLLFAYCNRIPLFWRRNFSVYLGAGLLGAVLPFVLFAYAAHHLPAPLLALFNATGPLFCALFSMLWLAEPFSVRKWLGLALGVIGVWVLAAGGLSPMQPGFFAFIACLIAPACFALSGVIVKRHTSSQNSHSARIDPLALATGAMLAASLILLPTLPFSLPAQMPSPLAIATVLALALIPSALAQIIYIPLISKIGPTRAMSVAFLIPLFSMLWGYVFLHEAIGLSCLLGGLTVLVATGLVIKP